MAHEPTSPRPAANPQPGGLVLVDKEAGPSSFSVVSRVRRKHGLKAGHAGTLDPFASGLLLVLLGRATRLARYLVGLDKRYLATIELGVRTSTGDPEGEELARTAIPTRERIQGLRGEIELPIPTASAVKIEGERAYRLHRRGVAVDMPLRRSFVHELEIRRFDPPGLELELLVSSGTYVRAIADALGGHCHALRRLEVGPFSVQDADEGRVLAPLDAVRHLPRRPLDDEEARAVAAGRPVPSGESGPLALVLGEALIAVAQADGGVARPETVLA